MTQLLELIRLRCFAPSKQEAEAQLRMLLPALSDSNARLFQSTEAPSDLSVHLTSPLTRPRAASASTVALRIAEALREFGQVQHTTWVEIPTESAEQGR